MKRIAVLAVILVGGCKQNTKGPMIEVDQTELLFGQEYGNATLLGTAPNNTLQIINSGGADLVISSVTVGSGGTDPDSGVALDSPQVFTVTGGGPNITTIGAGKTGFVQVVFTPTAVGFYGAVLTIASNASNSPTVTVNLEGDCVAPIVGIPGWDGGIIDLGSVALVAVPAMDGGEPYRGGLLPDGGLATATITISNLGAVALQFSTPYPDGGSNMCATSQCAELSSDAGDPSVVIPTWHVDGPIPFNVPPVKADGGAFTSTLTVTFGPYFPGDYTQHVNVATNAANQPLLSFTVHALATPDGGGS